ncbi:hypothetical protein [Azospirillum picis]|uniref:Uncharacterized protein n=1 Tax=Azospirillum picis TaxID=488438 RepID=A0ABU0MTX7_9PROT|nr:hypothetical protein [Azospirillum picis]MBP2302852.1 hypothetical protein [Azospirillum picis]MDQ0536643.1 hypothetical protein [Azospirillum picis]
MNDASKHGKPEHGKDKPAAGRPAEAGESREKTLTEKSEDAAGGANRKTPGPIYDV